MNHPVDPRPRPAAVLFDMDGTLVDSEPLWDIALSALAAHHGGTLSTRSRLEMLGRNDADTMEIFYRELDLPAPDPDADARFLTAQMTELFTTELRWQPGAAELVAEVRAAGLPTALVTSTARALVDVALTHRLGRDTFDTVVCGDEVTHAKPHPEPYRTAARQLGVPVDRCVAIEDSPTGVRSASAAGAIVVGVQGLLPLAGLDGAHVVASLAEVDLAHLAGLATTGAATWR